LGEWAENNGFCADIDYNIRRSTGSRSMKWCLAAAAAWRAAKAAMAYAHQ